MIAIYYDINRRSIFLQRDLKTEKGYSNRAKSGKFEYKRCTKIEIWRTEASFSANIEPDFVIHVHKNPKNTGTKAHKS